MVLPIERITDVGDALTDVKDLLQCVWMAAGLVEPSEPIQQVLDIALDRIDGIKEAIETLKQEEGGRAVADFAKD